MSYSAAQFEKALAIVGALPKDGPVKPSQDDQLTFYKYFKQAKVGDVNTTRPGMLDFVGKAKWDAWKSVEGVATEEAQFKYVAHFIAILEKDGSETSLNYKKEIESA